MGKDILYPFDGRGNLLNYVTVYQEEGDYTPNQTAIDRFFQYRISSGNVPTTLEIQNFIDDRTVNWKPQREFSAYAEILDYHQGRSAFHLIARFHEHGQKPWTANIPLSSLMYIIKYIHGGRTIYMDWKFSKKGQNHFVVPIEKDDVNGS